MSHFRKIVVNDIEYRYIVSKNVTRIQKRISEKKYEKMVEYNNSVYGAPFYDGDVIKEYIVQPSNVKNMIEGKPFSSNPCKYHPLEIITGLTYDPFDLEVYDRKTIIENCPYCLQALIEHC